MRNIARYTIAIFLISFSTLLFEISLTRVFSVTLWYHFGFLIISTALLGFGISGVVLSSWRTLRENYPVDKAIGRLSVFLSLSIVVCFWLLQQVPFDPFSLYTDPWQLLYMPLTYILVSIPFFFAGLALSLLFTRFPTTINRLYAFDLAGAALGCIAVIFTMPHFGGGGSVLLAAPIASIAALLFFRWRAVPVFLITIGIALYADTLIPLRITGNKAPGLRSRKPALTRWNTFSRVDLYLDTSELAPEKKAPEFVIDQGTAGTGLDFDLKPDVQTVLKRFSADSLFGSCLAYLGKKDPSLLIIGSGCGSQVVDALHHGAKKITAVEINPIINDVVTKNEYWADLFRQRNVHLVTDEGRNYVRSSKERYDAIISVHTISNAAIASGALSLSENYVLTKEAFEDYYDHLTDSGIIYFTRPEFQLPRLFATGKEVLQKKGIVDADAHFYAYTARAEGARERKSFYAIFIMSRKPLLPQQVQQFDDFINLTTSELPVVLYDPYTARRGIYDTILHTADLDALYKKYPFELAPATDNTPFFNHHTRWSSLTGQSFKDIFSQRRMGRLALEDKPIAEVTLIVLLVQVLVIAALFILLPLRRFSASALRTKKVFPYLFYFSGLGCGFIMVEMVMIQLFGLLLGEPVYTFAIVLGALLLFAGAGSYLSKTFAVFPKRTLRKSILVLFFLLLAASFFLPSLLRLAIALPVAGRVVLSIILIMPLGIVLGMPFPSGIQLIGREAPALIPWAWGVNGFFTVIGSILAIMLSMTLGFQAVLWIAAAIYLLSMIVLTA